MVGSIVCKDTNNGEDEVICWPINKQEIEITLFYQILIFKSKNVIPI